VRFDPLPYLRIGYRHLGRGWHQGDCWNLVQRFYERELGIALQEFTEYAENWADEGLNFLEELPPTRGFVPADPPRFGDLVVFRYRGRVYHCGVALEPPYFLHTHLTGTSIHDFYTGTWARRLHAVWRHRQRDL